MNNSTEVLVTFKGDTTDLDQKTSKASGAIKGLAKGFGGILATGASVATTAIAGATTAIVDLTKQSVNAYADYEQLIGGVETLFKESAGKVEEYANNAYKTAGLSANQYLEQATSFSARLIRDTGGDTEKVAELVDLAITDMADNANKMGTSIELIQNAYEGLAKGNATMLDNLKVGYGGTSTEMLKLAQDMGIVGQEVKSFQDMSFEEAILAIHKVQEELGITGTTAKEASTTIQGSLKMTESAWSNLVAGFSKEGVDLGPLVDNLIDSVMTFIDNIAPVVVRAVEGIAQALPLIAQKIGELLPQLIQSLLPPLIQAVITLVQSLAQNLPTIIMTLTQGLVQAIKGLATVLPQIIDALLKATITIIQALAEALPDLLPTIISAILSVIPLLIENLPLFIKAGVQLIVGLVQGLIQSIPAILKALKDMAVAMFGYLKQLPSMFIDIGTNLIKGLWNGIKNVTQWITDKIKGFGKSVMKAIKGIFGIASPSKEFAWIGKMNVLGLEEGMEDMQPQLQRTIDGLFNLQPNVSGSMKSTYSPQMNVVVNNNMELDPLGQVVNKIKTFSGGAKNDYNWGATQ